MTSIPEYCPVCQSKNINSWAIATDYEYGTTKEAFYYYGCDDCATIFIHPIPVDQLGRIYPPNYYSFAGQSKNIVFGVKEWFDKRFFKKVLKKLTAPKIDVLDIGGGTGWLLNLIKKSDNRVNSTQVVDIDERAKEVAIKNGHAYFAGTIEEFNPDKKFDLILMLNLIEHVADPTAVLQKAETILQPNGLIIIKTPNTQSWDAQLFKKTYWGGLHSPRHWIIFSAKSFQLLLKNTTLSLDKLSYTQGAPFWAFSIIAALHRKKMIHISSQKPIIYHWLFPVLSALFAGFDFLRKPFAKTSQMFIILRK